MYTEVILGPNSLERQNHTTKAILGPHMLLEPFISSLWQAELAESKLCSLLDLI